MDILNAQGGPYFDGVDLSRPQDGDWIRVDYDLLSASFDVAVGTAISGDLYLEFTADPQKLKGISRVVLPDGCLHGNVAAVTLPTARTTVNLASASSCAFSVLVSAPGVGWMRWRWLGTGGGGAPNKLYGFLTGSREP